MPVATIEAARNINFSFEDETMASGNDMKAANETYTGFIGMVKWGAIAVAIVVIFVVGLIASHAK